MAFITGDDEITDFHYYSSEDLANNHIDIKKSLANKSEKSKYLEHSTQDKDELGSESFLYDSVLSELSVEELIVDPPYDPVCMARFLEDDDINFRAVKTKVTDSVGRPYKIKSDAPIKPDDQITEADRKKGYISESEFQKESKAITDFIKNVNDAKEFEDICFEVGMDKEGIGWGAFEVIRSFDGKIARLNHLPASRLRVLKGFTGFVEVRHGAGRQYTYYLPFGHKIGTYSQDPISGEETFVPYTPEKDGPIDVSANCQDGKLCWNLKNKDARKARAGVAPTNYSEAANEVLFLPTPHSNTIYYGYTDGVPAIGAMVANSYIKDYIIQFFEHNTIPRYAVIVKGAKIDPEFRKMIDKYFKSKIKGSAHQTLVLTLSGMNNRQIDITFERLDADQKEADFIETRKSNNQIIMTSHGLSGAILGINDAASLGSGKGMSQAELYRDRVAMPLQLYWQRKLGKLFRLGLGVQHANIQFEVLEVRDMLSAAQALNLFLQNGVMTINEARRELGAGGPLEGGDEAFVRIKNASFVRVADIPELQSAVTDDNIRLSDDGSPEDIEIDLGT